MPAGPGDLAAYLLELHRDGIEASTIRRRAVAVGRQHVADGHDNPTEDRRVESVVRGAFEEQHYEPDRKRRVDRDDVVRLVEAVDHEHEAQVLRDRAVILMAWATEFRRGELASLTVADIDWLGEEGLVVQLRREVNRYQQKDPEQRILSRARGSKWCPLASLEAWLRAAAITGGSLFRRIDRWGNIWPDGLKGQSLTFIVQRAAEAAGLDPEEYGMQSFRALAHDYVAHD